ncbi:MAG: WYL domain-containing transcriptional regulator [Clostridia bacterium]|nr:WYL domain-containing transcriptional regulator [Clostridia bacterium]
MAGVQKSKLKLLYIVDILRKKTDENHYLAATEICDELSQLDIPAERKSIYNDIDILREYGFDIIHTGSKNRGGYFLGAREFELAELRLLSDAVQAANFISQKKTNQLVQKIESFASEKQAKILHSQVYVDNRPKCKNEEIYYTISLLDEAISAKVKVNFTYTRRRITEEFKTAKEEKSFTVSPYALIWSDDHYYLVCNNEKYDNLMHLRIDKIKHLEKTSLPARHFSEVSDYKNYFDSADYASKLFNMYSGEPKPVEFICNNDTLEPMLDRFGENVKIQKYDDEHFVLRTNVASSEGLVAWIVQFGGRVKVKSPNDLIYSVKQKAAEILEIYD